MKRCRWEGCKRIGPWTETDRNGLIWTNLCTQHHEDLEMALGTKLPAAILKVWIKAQGGAKKAAARFMRR